MTASPNPAALARLLDDLGRCAGDDLERSLADAALWFAGLGAHGAPRLPGAAQRAARVFTLERAQHELAQLVRRELARLLALGARSQELAPAIGPRPEEIAELIEEELECARSLECLPAHDLGELQVLARGLSQGRGDALSLWLAAERLGQLSVAR